MEINNISFLQEIIDKSDIVDLSHTMESNMPVWPTHARFGTIVYESYDEGEVSFHRQICLGEHTGTHIDAPKHFFKDGKSEEEVNTVIGRGVKINADFLNPREVYTLEMMKEFENKFGEVKKGDILLFRFGWEDKYGIGENSKEFLKDWPGLGGDVAEYLLEKNVMAVGSDALSLDVFESNDFPCHNILLKNGIPIIENLKNLKELPTYSFVIGLANKIKDSSGFPIRIISLIDKNRKEE